MVTVKVPPKDVNTYQNNQSKFAAGAGTIPTDQMKCNILKAKRDEEMKKAGEGKSTGPLLNCASSIHELFPKKLLLQTLSLSSYSRYSRDHSFYHLSHKLQLHSFNKDLKVDRSMLKIEDRGKTNQECIRCLMSNLRCLLCEIKNITSPVLAFFFYSIPVKENTI